MTTVDAQIAELREVIRKLEAVGDDGFEGLMAVVLTEITKTSFSLAKSGSQRGKDGHSALDSGAISFEGKLYNGKVPKDEVLTKIAQIAADDEGSADLWILASTGIIKTQDRDTIGKLGERLAIGTLILDWSLPGLPALAALLAMARGATASFLAARTATAEADLLAKLDAVRSHAQFHDRVQELTAAVEQPSVAPAYALTRNQQFLSAAFRSTKKARNTFGQPLAPGDTNAPGVLDRAELRQNLANLVFGKPNGVPAGVLGADGNGKSWLFAQAWLQQDPKPLTVVLVPDDISTPFTPASLENLLISRLMLQSGNGETEISQRRWRKHFQRWRRAANPPRARLLVFMDGLNQRESVNWVKIVNSFSELMAEVGGKFVFSCRTPFYRSVLNGRLLDGCETVNVPEWTNSELDRLLADRGAAIANLKPAVVDFLRNPRIFGVAADLFEKKDIEGFTELSVSRLLFEHIRMGASPAAEPVSVPEFVKGVREHADEIIKRLRAMKKADLKVFERPSGMETQSLEGQLAVISAGRFFEEVEGDPTFYSLRDDSTPLALGLSLLSTARGAKRNDLNIAEELSNILDPISALDNTAEVLISALVAAVLDDDIPEDIIAALAVAFVSLQNLDASRYEEFRALARRRPSAFLSALEIAAPAEAVTANLSWLVEGLFEIRREGNCWPAVAKACRRWLSMYSTAAERRVLSHHPPGSDERATEYDKQKHHIENVLARLSPTEKSLLDGLVLEERGDYTKLNKTAFRFLAGGPLTEFGQAFRDWCFAAAFNGGYHHARDEFDHMVQFNRVDWLQTRDAMLEAAKVLQEIDVSETGRWALAYVLLATGAAVDAQEGVAIVEELTRDREKFEGWRLIEDWCASDPCDPASEEPDNIQATADKYAALDVTRLRKFMGQSIDDHFFDDARVGLARFEPDAAVTTMRRFAIDVLNRGNADFRSAAFLLENHTAALDYPAAVEFVNRAKKLARDAIHEEDPNRELFVASQFALAIAFPHITGDEQLAAVLALPTTRNIILSVCDLMQSADSAKYESALEKACADGDANVQFRLMVFGQYSHTPMTDRAKVLVGQLTASSDALVRLCALGLVGRLGDPALLRIVAASDWNANSLDSTSTNFEVFYGSEVLVQAAIAGIIPVAECLQRVTLGSCLGLLCSRGDEAAAAVAAQIDAALARVINCEVKATSLDIEQRIDRTDRPGLPSVREKSNTSEDLHEQLKRASETGGAWYARQRRNQEALERFNRELTKAGADLVIQSITSELIAQMFLHQPQAVRRWYEAITRLDPKTLGRVHNLGLVVAQVIAFENQAGSATLFDKLTTTDPFVRVTFGPARISLDAVAVWCAADGDELRKLRFRRLDQARTDHELGIEVLAAIRAGRQDCLREYVLDRRDKPEPSHIARAIMVAGLGEDAPWALETIETHKHDQGFLGEAYKAAKYAMDRFCWSRHWAESMRDAIHETDLWRHAILLTRIVDGRFKANEIENGRSDELMKRYGPTFNDLIRARIDRWKAKREKKLFGMDAPSEMFLTLS